MATVAYAVMAREAAGPALYFGVPDVESLIRSEGHPPRIVMSYPLSESVDGAIFYSLPEVAEAKARELEALFASEGYTFRAVRVIRPGP